MKKWVFSIGLISLILWSSQSFSRELDLRLKQSINLKNLSFITRKRLLNIKPEDGFIIEVRGERDSLVKIELEGEGEGEWLRVVEYRPEREIIRLDNNGEGTFKVGLLIVLKGVLPPGNHISEVKAEVSYLK